MREGTLAAAVMVKFGGKQGSSSLEPACYKCSRVTSLVRDAIPEQPYDGIDKSGIVACRTAFRSELNSAG